MADSSTLVDRVKIFVESSGTGPFQLGNALPSFRGSEALTDGLTYSYAVESGSDYEVGQGVYVLAVDQLIRSPTLSSAGGAPVSFPANVAINFTALAADLVAGQAGTGTVTSIQGSGGTTGLTLTGGPITQAGTLTLGGVLGIANGGTGGTNATEARTGIGLGNVNNTSDADKPISTATLTALAGKVDIADLIDPTGAEMVGLAEDGTVQDAITYITPQMKGGNYVVDSTAALEDTLLGIINTNQPAVINKRVRVDGAITSAGNVSLRGDGIIDLSGGGSLTFGTGVTPLPNLSANIVLFGTTATFASAHGLVIGDVFAVWNPTDFSQGLYRDVYRAGDMFRVAEVISTTQVRFFGCSRSLYAFGDVEVYKLNGGRLNWDGVGLIPSNVETPLFLDGLVDVSFHRPFIHGGTAGTMIEIFRCFGTTIFAPEIIHVDETDGYPIIISNSQNGVIDGMSGIYSGWHCVSFGGRDGDATVPSADWLVTNVIATNKGNVGVGALESHGGCKRIMFDGFETHSFNPGGEDITARNGTIYGRSPASFADGNCINGSETVGGTFLFENLRCVSAGNGTAFASHVNIDADKRSKDFLLIERNCTFENVGTGSATARVHFINPGTAANTNRIDVVVDGLVYDAPAAPITLFGINNTQDISAISSIRVDNYSGPLDLLLTATNSANLNIPFSGNLRGELTGYASRGQNNVTLAADRVQGTSTFSAKTNNWDASFGTNRTVTLSTTRARAGDTFRIVRTGGSTGGPFTLDVGTGPLKQLTQNQWCDVTFNGTAWGLSAFGSL